MKLGGFGKITDYDLMRQAGFDYAELDVPEIEALPDGEFHAFCEKVQKAGFPVLTGSRALPVAEPWFFTEHFRAAEYEPYLKHACRRAGAGMLGMKKVILGNGKARWLPDETGIQKEDRFIDFMKMFAETAGEQGLEVILEPLGPIYSNYINTLPEAVRVIQKIQMPNLFTMADLRHMVWSKESFEDLSACAEYVHHIHIDYPLSYPQRPFPGPEDDYDYTEFLDALVRSGYQGTLTVEADIPEDWKKAYMDAAAVLKEIL